MADARSLREALPAELQQAARAPRRRWLLTMVLPWYEKSYFVRPPAGGRPATDRLSALQVFSFVEAAVLLVAAGVLYLVWSRAQRKAFHLPGGDGTVIMAAGGWALAAARVAAVRQARRRRPRRHGGDRVGDVRRAARRRRSWPRGARVRAAHAPEPPNPAAEDPAGSGRRAGAAVARSRATRRRRRP